MRTVPNDRLHLHEGPPDGMACGGTRKEGMAPWNTLPAIQPHSSPLDRVAFQYLHGRSEGTLSLWPLIPQGPQAKTLRKFRCLVYRNKIALLVTRIWAAAIDLAYVSSIKQRIYLLLTQSSQSVQLSQSCMALQLHVA